MEATTIPLQSLATSSISKSFYENSWTTESIHSHVLLNVCGLH